MDHVLLPEITVTVNACHLSIIPGVLHQKRRNQAICLHLSIVRLQKYNKVLTILPGIVVVGRRWDGWALSFFLFMVTENASKGADSTFSIDNHRNEQKMTPVRVWA